MASDPSGPHPERGPPAEGTDLPDTVHQRVLRQQILNAVILVRIRKLLEIEAENRRIEAWLWPWSWVALLVIGVAALVWGIVRLAVAALPS